MSIFKKQMRIPREKHVRYLSFKFYKKNFIVNSLFRSFEVSNLFRFYCKYLMSRGGTRFVKKNICTLTGVQKATSRKVLIGRLVLNKELNRRVIPNFKVASW